MKIKILLSISLLSLSACSTQSLTDNINAGLNTLNKGVAAYKTDLVYKRQLKPRTYAAFNCLDGVLFTKNISGYYDYMKSVIADPGMNKVFTRLPPPDLDDMGGDTPNFEGFVPKGPISFAGIVPKKVIITAADWGGGGISVTLVSPYSFAETVRLVEAKTNHKLTPNAEMQSVGETRSDFKKVYKVQGDGYTYDVNHEIMVKENTSVWQFPDSENEKRIEVECAINGY